MPRDGSRDFLPLTQSRAKSVARVAMLTRPHSTECNIDENPRWQSSLPRRSSSRGANYPHAYVQMRDRTHPVMSSRVDKHRVAFENLSNQPGSEKRGNDCFDEGSLAGTLHGGSPLTRKGVSAWPKCPLHTHVTREDTAYPCVFKNIISNVSSKKPRALPAPPHERPAHPHGSVRTDRSR